MELILKYFPDLSELQKSQLSKLGELYRTWNAQINVISRKDIENLYEHHVLHSLALAKFVSFYIHTEILDVGTGGGFPGIPLAIIFPKAKFHLVDSTHKKIRVVNEVISALGLENATAEAIRSNELKHRYDFVISRAVTAFPEFVDMVRRNIHQKNKNKLPNGILYWKGGDLTSEIEPFKNKVNIFGIQDVFSEEFFQTKSIIYLPVK